MGRGLAKGEPGGQLIDRTDQYTHCLLSHEGAGRQMHRLHLGCVCEDGERASTLCRIGLKPH